MNIDDLHLTKYGDNKDYVFISYSAEDEKKVFGEYVIPLQEKHGLRVFWDKSFNYNASDGWVKQMDINMRNAKACIIFMSSTYAASYACLLEVLTALACRKPIIKVKIETPEVTHDNSERVMGLETVEYYKRVIKRLDDHKNVGILDCIDNIRVFIESGAISEYQVSDSFCPLLLTAIPGTRITKVEQIKESVSKYDVFEEINLDKPKDEPKAKPKVGTDKPKSQKDNKNINISAKINQILMVVDRVKSEPNTNDYQAAVNSAAEYVSRELEVTRSAVTDKCQRQLGLSAKEFQDLLMKHIVNNDDELFNIVLEQAKTDEEKEAVRETFKINSEITDSGNEEIVSEDTPVKEKGNLEVYYIDNVRKEGNQAKMMWDVFEALAEKYPEKIADLTQISNVQLSHNVTNPGTKESNPTCFMSYKSFMVNGQEYLVGTCYNKADKLRRISKMLNICGAPADFFVIE